MVHMAKTLVRLSCRPRHVHNCVKCRSEADIVLCLVQYNIDQAK